MSPEDVLIVQKTWRAVLPIGDTFAELFYGKLFSLDPALRPMFRESLKEQGRNLTAMLSVAVGGLAHPEKIMLGVRELGRRHAAYGVQPAHYETAWTALVWALERCFGEAFTPQARAAWTAAYRFFAATMQDAAKRKPVDAATAGSAPASMPGGAARAP